jgi:hypothetical protein
MLFLIPEFLIKLMFAFSAHCQVPSSWILHQADVCLLYSLGTLFLNSSSSWCLPSLLAGYALPEFLIKLMFAFSTRCQVHSSWIPQQTDVSLLRSPPGMLFLYALPKFFIKPMFAFSARRQVRPSRIPQQVDVCLFHSLGMLFLYALPKFFIKLMFAFSALCQVRSSWIPQQADVCPLRSLPGTLFLNSSSSQCLRSPLAARYALPEFLMFVNLIHAFSDWSLNSTSRQTAGSLGISEVGGSQVDWAFLNQTGIQQGQRLDI